MKQFAIALVLATTGIAVPASAQKDSPMAPTQAAEPASHAQATPDEQTVQKGQELLAAVSGAYRNAPTLTDTMTTEISGPGAPEKWVSTVMLGPGTDGLLIFDDATSISVDGKLYVMRENVTDKYVAADLDGSMDKTMRKVFSEMVAMRLPLAVALRNPDSAGKVLERITLGMLDKPQITGVTTIKDDSGRTFEQISFSSQSGSGTANIDPQTRLVHGVKFTLSPSGAPEGFSVNINSAMNPQVHEKLPKAIAFDPGTRSAVENIRDLQPKPLAVGDAAPDFTLRTLDGETVTLSQLRGSVVVLDFWATWCGPCRMALPSLQKFSDWAKDSGKPVKVFALNTWERLKTDEEKHTKVKEFWTSKNFTMPTLMDLDGAVATRYQVSSIPRSFVIGPDGIVRQVHMGFAQTMADDLQKEALELLKAKE